MDLALINVLLYFMAVFFSFANHAKRLVINATIKLAAFHVNKTIFSITTYVLKNVLKICGQT